MYDMLITAISTLELSEWAGQAIQLNLRIPQHFTVPKAEQNHSFEFSEIFNILQPCKTNRIHFILEYFDILKKDFNLKLPRFANRDITDTIPTTFGVISQLFFKAHCREVRCLRACHIF